MDESLSSSEAALDTARAVDREWWKGFLAKQQVLGVSASALDLLRDYVLDKPFQSNSQRDRVNKTVDASIPQGRVLGLLWNVYFADFHIVPESHSYADKCTLVFTYSRGNASYSQVHQSTAYRYIS